MGADQSGVSGRRVRGRVSGSAGCGVVELLIHVDQYCPVLDFACVHRDARHLGYTDRLAGVQVEPRCVGGAHQGVVVLDGAFVQGLGPIYPAGT